MARDMRRQLDSAMSFAASSPKSFDLPKDAVYKEIVLEASCLFTTAAGGAITAPFEGSPWSAIKRIELIADGKDVIKSYDGNTLHDINYFDFGTYAPTEDFDAGAAT